MSSSIHLAETPDITKRGIVSDVAKTYDILGWISSCVLSMKMLYQQLWKRGIDWDDPVPPDLEAQHTLWKELLPLLTQKQLPRCYFRKDAPRMTTELHGFSEASEKAWGAVVYVRSTYEHHPPVVALVISKTKVIKPENSTIPRKELCGAPMLAKLLTLVGAALGIPQDHTYGWTDSSIVLAWLDGSPRELDVFVSNRVRAILQLTTPHSWKHVPTLQNPADCASRGIMPQELLAHSLWWEGPSWLLTDPVDIPWQPPRRPLPPIERRLVHVSSTIPPQWIEGRYESYHKCILITAWCLRFVHRFLHRLRQKEPPEDQPLYMTSTELVASEHVLVRMSQARSFPKDIQQLLTNKPISNHSTLRKLSPYLEKEQLLRVGGRLSNSALTYSQQHPLITSGKDDLVILLFNYLHIRFGHCGPTLLLCATGTRFHVVGARALSRTVCSQCITCRKAAPKPLPQYMADLPLERVI